MDFSCLTLSNLSRPKPTSHDRPLRGGKHNHQPAAIWPSEILLSLQFLARIVFAKFFQLVINFIHHYDQYGFNCINKGVVMINEVNAVTFRQNLGEMLNQVQYRHDSILIKKDGKPVAALVDAQLFDRIRRFKDRFETLSQQIADAYATVPEDEGLDEINALVTETRHSQR